MPIVCFVPLNKFQAKILWQCFVVVLFPPCKLPPSMFLPFVFRCAMKEPVLVERVREEVITLRALQEM